MKKAGIVLIAALFLTSGAAVTAKTSVADVSPNSVTPTPEPMAIWDLQLSFNLETATGALGNAGAEFDGTYFYVTRWASNLIIKLDTSGVQVEQFSIPGVTGLRDLAFDGQYMYGGAAATTIYKMDFTTKTLIGTITSTTAVRAITYDPVNDGFWVCNWDTDIVCISRTGSVLDTITCPSTTVSKYGLAYDEWSAGGPFLWVFDQGSSQALIHQLDIATGTLTGVSHDCAVDFSNSGIAGGLFATDAFEPGYFTLGGVSQGTPDMFFCYEICTTEDIVPPETTCTLDGVMEGGVYITDVNVTLTATDGGSGVNYTMIAIDGGTFEEYTGTVVVSGNGNHEIQFYSEDNAGNVEDTKTETFTIEYPSDIQIEISGGFGVKATLTNGGTEPMTACPWSIDVQGGLILIGKHREGTVDLAAGASTTVGGLVIGLGSALITVHADTKTKTGQGTVLLFFVKMLA